MRITRFILIDKIYRLGLRTKNVRFLIGFIEYILIYIILANDLFKTKKLRHSNKNLNDSNAFRIYTHNKRIRIILREFYFRNIACLSVLAIHFIKCKCSYEKS